MSLELAFAEMCELGGADVLEGLERTRTADLSSLRVRGQWLLSVTEGIWKHHLGKGFSVPCIAYDCKVLLAGKGQTTDKNLTLVFPLH